MPELASNIGIEGNRGVRVIERRGLELVRT